MFATFLSFVSFVSSSSVLCNKTLDRCSKPSFRLWPVMTFDVRESKPVVSSVSEQADLLISMFPKVCRQIINLAAVLKACTSTAGRAAAGSRSTTRAARWSSSRRRWANFALDAACRFAAQSLLEHLPSVVRSGEIPDEFHFQVFTGLLLVEVLRNAAD